MVLNMTLHGLLAIGYANHALCLLHDTGKMLGQLRFNAGRTLDSNRNLCRVGTRPVLSMTMSTGPLRRQRWSRTSTVRRHHASVV